MSKVVESVIQELEQEGHATRRLLERVPSDKLGWKPHPKSMSLGQLALHVATAPRAILQFLGPDQFNLEGVDITPEDPTSSTNLVAEFDQAMGDMRQELGGYDDARVASTWRLLRGTRVLMEAPRAALLRSLLCNHLYHHRGQLTVYLRMLDVPLPAIYGPSADENPFG